MVMIRPQGRALQIFEEIFSLDSETSKEQKRASSKGTRANSKIERLQEREQALNPRRRPS